jgi:xylulokinase
MKYLLGIDIGTSGIKAVLFDETLNQIISATVNYEMQQPFPSWAEQDPKVWWDSTCQCIN